MSAGRGGGPTFFFNDEPTAKQLVARGGRRSVESFPDVQPSETPRLEGLTRGTRFHGPTRRGEWPWPVAPPGTTQQSVTRSSPLRVFSQPFPLGKPKIPGSNACLIPGGPGLGPAIFAGAKPRPGRPPTSGTQCSYYRLYRLNGEGERSHAALATRRVTSLRLPRCSTDSCTRNTHLFGLRAHIPLVEAPRLAGRDGGAGLSAGQDRRDL